MKKTLLILAVAFMGFNDTHGMELNSIEENTITNSNTSMTKIEKKNATNQIPSVDVSTIAPVVNPEFIDTHDDLLSAGKCWWRTYNVIRAGQVIVNGLAMVGNAFVANNYFSGNGNTKTDAILCTVSAVANGAAALTTYLLYKIGGRINEINEELAKDDDHESV